MILSLLRKGCRVGFIGLGKSNIALLSRLPLKNCEVTLRSNGSINREIIPKGLRVANIFEGADSLRQIDEDILFLSPSVRRDRPELKEAAARGVILTSDFEMFFKENRVPVLAVTGSDGKSTTATLIHLMLLEGGYRSALIGNIGEPMWSHIDDEVDFFVCELSSFMLSCLTPIVMAACITNITPNHLDWHRNFEEYKKTKISLLNCSEKRVVTEDFRLGDCIISDRLSYDELLDGRSAGVYFTIEEGFICRNKQRILALSVVKRGEPHNIRNLMMAMAMTDGLIDRDAVRRVAIGFEGLCHRSECFLIQENIEYIDSSIDSTPARTAQTLRSLNKRVVLILGGRGKGLDYGELLPEIRQYAEAVMICGENAKEIYDSIAEHTNAEIKDSLESAVIRGRKILKDGGTLLLSPASTSYDRYKNYAERGDDFKRICRKICEDENYSLQNIEETRKKSETNLS